ncbi:Uncharacterized protein TCM_040090 [Theobroma cacao]|uniref:Uncharacterized protein n=1 Tax=Theobroma cacao TaxID=3641 RepID=A0A061GSD4_THECC|nr:Uncharacterized protein TCM_040090 [Theobroma cacao]
MRYKCMVMKYSYPLARPLLESYVNNFMYEIMMMAREPIWTPKGADDVNVYIIVHYDSLTVYASLGPCIGHNPSKKWDVTTTMDQWGTIKKRKP